MRRLIGRIFEWVVYFLMKLMEGVLWLDDRLREWVGYPPYKSKKKNNKKGKKRGN